MKMPILNQIGGRPEPTLAGRERSNPLTVCFVTALTVADFIDPDLSIDSHTNSGAQLGVLTLSAILREQGINPYVLNLDDLFFTFIRRTEATADGFFFPFVVEQLKQLSFDVFGFSSICSSYPLTLRLAQEVKHLRPDARVVLGGPQASVVDVTTMRAFPCIDFIVRGEADETFPALINRLSRPGDAGQWADIPGITYRRGAEVIRNQNASVVGDLDRLPLPAFDLDCSLKDRGGIHLEIGRGCPFACTFCSTNDFFRRNFRLKSPQKMIGEISFIKREYGLEYFSLVHDMYTIDRKKVVAFCEAIIESKERFTWGCSARTDCIDDELINLMAAAGCSGIFFGIETGSPRLQEVINKRLDLDEAVRRIECADRNGIQTTVALIVGFPEETRDDLRDTVHFFIDSLRFDHAQPQCSLLAPLAATPLYEQYRERLIFDHVFSDMSFQSWRQDPAEVELIKSYPDIFPNFYAIPTRWLERGYVNEVMNFITYLATWFRWLPVALLQDSGDLLQVFDRWRRWRSERCPGGADEDTGYTPYYSHRRFRNELLEFVQTCYLKEMATARAAVAAVAQMESAPAGDLCPSACGEAAGDDLWEAEAVPYIPDHLSVMELAVDYTELVESLRRKTDLSRVTERKVTVISVPRGGKQVQVWQLPQLSAALLRLCDGRRTVGEIISEFSQLETAMEGIPAEKVCLFGLAQMRQDGFIALSSSLVAAEQSAASDDAGRGLSPLYSLTPQATNTQQPWPPVRRANN